MARLKVDINAMNSASKTLENVSRELGEVIHEYDAIVSELSNSWDGAASEEFIRRLKTQIRELKTAKSSLEGIKEYSSDVADTMKRIDKILTQLLKGFMPV